MPEKLSNQTMYVLARDYYLKNLLDSGKISIDQFEQMSRFLHNYFDLENSSDTSWEAATLDAVVRVESNITELSADSHEQSAVNQPVQDIESSLNRALRTSLEYVSLTDIARHYNSTEPGYVISSWMRNNNTMEFLSFWEQAHNPDYDTDAFVVLGNQLKGSSTNISPKQWIEKTGAVGLKSKQGKNGGTFAHPTILCDFLSYLSPKYRLGLFEMSAAAFDNRVRER